MSAQAHTTLTANAAAPARARRTALKAGFGAAWLAALLAAGAAHAQSQAPQVDRFSATTASMTPRDLGLRFDVREWSDEAARAAVVEALGRATAESSGLADLPTIGYVWQNGSPVGYAVKYAHRVATEGGERITFVTDKRLGTYDRQPWAAEGQEAPTERSYSVIELYLDANGSGDGTLSLGAEVDLDEANAAVAIGDGDSAPRVLVNAKAEPKPYWARS